MKTIIKSSSLIPSLGLLLLFTTSCDRTHFRQVASIAEVAQTVPDYPVDPPTPPPVTPPVEPPTPPPVTPPVQPPTPPPVTPPVQPPTPPPVTPPVQPPTPPPVTPPVQPPTPPPVTPPVQPPTPPPVTPPVQPPTPPPVIPQPVQKSGACASDSSTVLLSCLKCLVPTTPPQPPQFSEKGKSLIDVMTIGCSIPNRSAPKGYVPPTKAELLARLNRLSPSFYPDSQMTADQKTLINGLLNDPKLQQKIFGGQWYVPPYSNVFEIYFGVSVAEMVYQICYQSPNSNFTPDGNTPLHSKEYMDCQYSDNSFNCKEKPEYVLANQYREQLRQGMKESIKNPYVPPAPTPAKSCKWESFDGDYDLGGEAVVNKWLKAGYKIGIEQSTQAGRCEPITSLPTSSMKPRGLVKLSAYICK